MSNDNLKAIREELDRELRHYATKEWVLVRVLGASGLIIGVLKLLGT